VQTSSRDSRPVLTVTELNHQARVTIEQRFNLVWVTGELSNFVRPRSGHWYFTLKDDSAQVRCAMFVNRNRHARIQPSDGQQVIVRGRVSLYEGRGDFQIIVDQMEPAGEGALRRAYDELKVKLDAEGLFSTDRKRDLPRFPQHAAVISSPSGAALHDVLAVWERRFPALRVTLIPTAVQGADAEPQIIAALARAAEVDPDVVVITRGGGSLEDLWAFNLEAVARAVAACPIPTVAAVGHEIDVTIVDFVADVRAPTPSAAAELTVPDAADLQAVFTTYERHLMSAWQRSHDMSKLTLSELKRGLVSPRTAIEQAYQRADDAMQRVQIAARNRLDQLVARGDALRRQLNALGPHRQIVRAREDLSSNVARLGRVIEQSLEHKASALSATSRMLTSVSPLPTLSRGYAVIQDPATGDAITSVGDATPGQRIKAQLVDGTLVATVEEVDANAAMEDPNL
jgi:exodeoxyribonuclease VII large subunit